MVVCVEYYNLLAVAPTATDDEVRRGYLRQAKKWHPDKNGGNPNAEERFKAIHDAYKVLSDPQLRSIYDEKGKDATTKVQSQADIDPVEQATELCRALFGNGEFETAFGDLTTFPLFVITMRFLATSLHQSHTELEAPPAIKEEMDKEAMEAAKAAEQAVVVDLADILRRKVAKATATGPEGESYADLYYQMCSDEAKYLSNTPGGADLVLSLGYVYSQEAKQHMGRYMYMERVWSEMEEKCHIWSHRVGLLKQSFKLLTVSARLQELEKKTAGQLKGSEKMSIGSAGKDGAERDALNDKRSLNGFAESEASLGKAERTRSDNQNSSAPGTSQQLGSLLEGLGEADKAHSQAKEELEEKLLKEVVAQGFSVLWALGKYLIEDRVRKVVQTLLGDKSVPHRERAAWAVALLELGGIYQEEGEKMKKDHVANNTPDQWQAAFDLPNFR